MRSPALKAGLELATVLFATDFTPASAAAGRYAHRLAQRFESRLLTVHVVRQEASEFLPPEVGPYLPDAGGTFAERQMKAWGDELDRLGLWHEELIPAGDVWPSLSAIIRQQQVDLVILGTHGRKGAAKLLLGSVAEEIARQASCPALVLGPHVTFRRWGRKNHYPERVQEEAHWKKILFATNFSPGTLVAAQQTLSLAQPDQGEVTLLHVPPGEPGATVQDPRVQSHLDQYVHRLARLIAPADAAGCSLEYVIKYGDVAESILLAAEQRGSDLIVMGVRNADRHPVAATHFSSVLGQVIAQAECPVLLLHP